MNDSGRSGSGRSGDEWDGSERSGDEWVGSERSGDKWDAVNSMVEV